MCRLIGIGNFLEIGIGKIWPILIDSSNITTLPIFPDQIVLYLHFFLPARNRTFLRKSLHKLSEDKKIQIMKQKIKEGYIALQAHFYCFASVAFNLNMALLKLNLSSI